MSKIYNKRFIAFTLAETLITLVIIGIIAALTVPNLIQKYVESQTVSKVKQSFSMLSQAYTLALQENGNASTWGLLPHTSPEVKVSNSNYVFNLMKPYLKFSKICESAYGCWPNINYKTLYNGATQVRGNPPDMGRRYCKTEALCLSGSIILTAASREGDIVGL